MHVCGYAAVFVAHCALRVGTTARMSTEPDPLLAHVQDETHPGLEARPASHRLAPGMRAPASEDRNAYMHSSHRLLGVNIPSSHSRRETRAAILAAHDGAPSRKRRDNQKPHQRSLHSADPIRARRRSSLACAHTRLAARVSRLCPRPLPGNCRPHAARSAMMLCAFERRGSHGRSIICCRARA
jgi:hypothetical protein